jgi:hypothetical protein
MQLGAFDTWESGAVSFTADSSNNPFETGSMLIVDESLYLGQDQTIKSGFENEANPPASIGAADISATFYIN